jgi:hypothetical protein
VIPKLEHQTATREENRVEPDCTNTGSYDLVTYCSVCGKELSRVSETIPALGHIETTREENRVEPTTHADGSYDIVTYCTRCNTELKRETVILPKLPSEEPTANVYYLGAIGNDTQQDIPVLWSEYGFDVPGRATHYLNYMKDNDTREYTENSLPGQHELTWTLRTPLGLDEELTTIMGEEIVITESDKIYPAIALPTGYKVTAWSTDSNNSYPVNEVIDSVETQEGYTIYYVRTACDYGYTPTYFITIIGG